MQLRKTATRTVNPVVAAVVIIVVLGVVQYVWWMKLVHKERATANGGPQSSMSGRRPLLVFGRKSVTVTTLAGAQEPGDSDGPGYAARFDGPTAVAVDAAGTVFVADTRNNRIRAVTPKGKTTTVAGGAAGFRDGAVKEALFDAPSGVAVGPDGALYVADTNNHRIRMIRNGQVSTVAGGSAGRADGPALSARFRLPTSLAIDASAPGGAALLIADSGNQRVCRLALGGASPTVATAASLDGVCTSVAVAPGRLAAACPEQGMVTSGAAKVTKMPVELGPQPEGFKRGDLVAGHPNAVCLVGSRLLLSDAAHGAVFEAGTTDAQVVAGICSTGGSIHGLRDGTGEHALLGVVTSMAYDGKSNIYIADCSNNAIRRITLAPASAARATSAPARPKS